MVIKYNERSTVFAVPWIKFPITIFYNESSCSQSVPKAPHFDIHLYKHAMTWSLRKSIEEIHTNYLISKPFYPKTRCRDAPVLSNGA